MKMCIKRQYSPASFLCSSIFLFFSASSNFPLHLPASWKLLLLSSLGLLQAGDSRFWLLPYWLLQPLPEEARASLTLAAEEAESSLSKAALCAATDIDFPTGWCCWVVERRPAMRSWRALLGLGRGMCEPWRLLWFGLRWLAAAALVERRLTPWRLEPLESIMLISVLFIGGERGWRAPVAMKIWKFDRVNKTVCV